MPDARDVGQSCAQVTQKHMSFDVETAKAVSSQILYQEQQVIFSRSVYRQNLTNMNPEKKHFCCRMTGHGRYILMTCMQEPNQSVRFIRTWNCRRLAVWFLESVRCLVDVAGFVFGVHNLLAPVQTKVSGKHVAESDSQKKIRHAIITEQFKTD